MRSTMSTPSDENYERDVAKMARMRLLSEDKTYSWEYETCERRVRARERCLQRREARRLSSNTKEPASSL